MQNLVVRKGDKKGRYFVVAGGRRLTAFQAVGGGGRDRHGDQSRRERHACAGYRVSRQDLGGDYRFHRPNWRSPFNSA
ncbi:hypothetical protein [Sinorhizobium meliloti]|uniref:hypothetical protein n=1 Tax=Rhizobium meliloti TaxID=382 RepID=UPI001F35C307|nr:hypothetical protein [Sinorhizobium meliloti]